ncbi:putative GNAT family acetyltransferase [Kribbella voronezhensis]|uniref:Putative GNAT family acetyltransferase n=1 Tax=Kribbella voronezhensis TaxID=2512212 RepID=A0A4V3FIQ2_9ACTN|nr:GNAT family N-acetyltransferase [Kribbella voronezhensis]TDU83293.1 putative GNAT family acetyltransferase [Kribbella voronezhensis]
MTEHARRPDGTGFYLVGGELTAAGSAGQAAAFDQPIDFSITAGLFGDTDTEVVVVAWSSTETDDLEGMRPVDNQVILPLRTHPLMLNSLPASVRVQLRTAGGFDDTEGIWHVTLHFRNQAGSGLTWHASLPTEAFGAGWTAPLADLLTIDGTDSAVADKAASHAAVQAVGAGASEKPAVTVTHHADDEYYELLVDGQRAGILVYHLIGSHLSITHTVIDQTYRGQGFSWVLIRHALDDLRTKSLTVSNYCAVVRHFVKRNPEYGVLFGPPQSFAKRGG